MMTDQQIRERILSILYAAWQRSGKHHRISLDDLFSAFNAQSQDEQIQVLRNLQLLADLGYVKMPTLRSAQLTAWGVLECERHRLLPEPLPQETKEVTE
jgi:Fe2+ or Zn2+ uptake regulation protein